MIKEMRRALVASLLAGSWLACGHDAGPLPEAVATDPSRADPVDGALAAWRARFRFQLPGAPRAVDPLRPGSELRRSDDGWRAVLAPHHSAQVRLPASADGAAELRDRRSGMAVRFRLEGARPAAGRRGQGALRYPAATRDGDDVIQRAGDDGVEDFLLLQQPPSAPIRYLVDVGEVAGLRQVGGVIEMLDAGGAPRLRISRPWLLDGDGRRHDLDLRILDCAFDADARLPWGRPVTPPGRAHCTVEVGWPRAPVAFPALLDPRWVTTRRMDQSRRYHTATTIAQSPPECGGGPVVIVTGGFQIEGLLARDSVEVYHPPTDTWCSVEPMVQARGLHTATYLDTAEGPKLVVAGGLTSSDTGQIVNSYERLPLDTFDWPAVGGLISLLGGRALHRADVITIDAQTGEQAVLLTGGYLFAGSQYIPGVGATGLNLPVTAEHPLSVRRNHRMVRLGAADEDRFLLVGGCPDADDTCQSWEIYCPHVECSDTGDELGDLSLHTATRITAQQVLVLGGIDDALDEQATAWLFNDNGATWTTITPMNLPMEGGIGDPVPRYGHTTSVLPDGDLVVAGGLNSSADTQQALRFTFGPTGWRGAGALRAIRIGHEASVIDGVVLLTGGEADDSGTSELYIPCDEHGDCAADAYCSPDSEACAPKELPGAPCDEAAICASGHCIDGVCCVSDCSDDPCKRCDLPGTVGLCSAIPAEDAPVVCLEQPHCIDDTTLWLDEETTEDCGLYRCFAATCMQQCNASADCAPGYVCNTEGKCIPPPENGHGEWLCAHGAPPDGRGWPLWLLALGAALRIRSARRWPARR